VDQKGGTEVRRLIAGLFVMVIVVGCSSTAQEIRFNNRENLSLLELGMSKRGVLDIMGTEAFLTDVAINNPYRTESFTAENGTLVEILFYYTDVKQDDNATTDDELMPIVLEDDALIGWGWTCLNRHYPSQEVTEIGVLRLR